MKDLFQWINKKNRYIASIALVVLSVLNYLTSDITPFREYFILTSIIIFICVVMWDQLG